MWRYWPCSSCPHPSFATADDLKQAVDGTLDDTVPINTMWVVIAAVLVLFMQAGFAMLEIGFSRGKNAGTGVAKILTNLSIAAVCYWAWASPSRSAARMCSASRRS